ncbi:hypothetical protein Cgig2_026508 [Carnegiea gigantea]|uniref:Uncharacterized protein n=1 Tax=Carnegiea gigantea TaxID=171969 RepID=A0A9Q1KGT0_9CARY|nr:hypothetical protein Cgig2_026508 [Carnegiea gigantea]
MVFLGGVRRLLWTFGSLAFALDVYSPALHGSLLNRLRLTTPDTLDRLVADAGTDTMVDLGSVVADQRLWELGTVCFKRSIQPVKRVELKVAWAKFQKRASSRPSKQREEPQKKMVSKWIPKKKLTSMPNEAPKALENNQQLASPYKQALLSYPNNNKLEAPNGNLEVAENDVHEGLLDNSKTITQPLDGAHNRPIFVGKFPSQAPSCGSSLKDDEEINSSLCPFDNALEMDIQFHEKREMAKHSNKGKNSGNRNSRLTHDSPTSTEIAKDTLDIGERLDISVVGDENSAIRRITRNLRKKIENKKQV